MDRILDQYLNHSTYTAFSFIYVFANVTDLRKLSGIIHQWRPQRGNFYAVLSTEITSLSIFEPNAAFSVIHVHKYTLHASSMT